MWSTRGQRDGSGVDLLGFVEDRVLESVHEKREPGEEHRHEDDEDSLHAHDYPPPTAWVHTCPSGAARRRVRAEP